jgi:hypothetical protein
VKSKTENKSLTFLFLHPFDLQSKLKTMKIFSGNKNDLHIIIIFVDVMAIKLP